MRAATRRSKFSWFFQSVGMLVSRSGCCCGMDMWRDKEETKCRNVRGVGWEDVSVEMGKIMGTEGEANEDQNSQCQENRLVVIVVVVVVVVVVEVCSKWT
jgi:hypothetical protein